MDGWHFHMKVYQAFSLYWHVLGDHVLRDKYCIKSADGIIERTYVELETRTSAGARG